MSMTAIVARTSPLRDRALVIWSACGVIFPCLAPSLGPLVLCLAVLVPVLLADRAALVRNARHVGPVLGMLAAIIVYLCLNAAIAPVTDNALGAIVTIALVGLVCHLAGTALPTVPVRDLRLMARGLVIGCLITASFLFVEYVSHMSILRAVQHVVVAAGLKSIRIQAGAWDAPTYTYMTRNLIVLIMVVWSGVAFALVIWKRSRHLVVPALLLMVLAAALLSPSATAKVGLIAGAGGWAAARIAPRLTGALLAATWTVVALACIPLAHVIHVFGLYEVEWINASLRHRMMIWSASSELFWQHPLLGLGIGGARKVNLNDSLHLAAKGIEGEPLNWHAHNSFVQAWFETGLVGGVLLCLFGLVVLRAIFRLPDAVRPAAVATFVSIFFIGLTGFSLWAAWYLAGYGLAALCILLATFMNREAAPLPGTTAG